MDRSLPDNDSVDASAMGRLPEPSRKFDDELSNWNSAGEPLPPEIQELCSESFKVPRSQRTDALIAIYYLRSRELEPISEDAARGFRRALKYPREGYEDVLPLVVDGTRTFRDVLQSETTWTSERAPVDEEVERALIAAARSAETAVSRS